MFCPCCAGRTTHPIHHTGQSGNVDGTGHSPDPEQFGIHRVSEPCKLRIQSELLGAPFPAIVNLVHIPILSFRSVLIIHCSQRNSFATVCLIGYTTLEYSGIRYGTT